VRCYYCTTAFVLNLLAFIGLGGTADTAHTLPCVPRRASLGKRRDEEQRRATNHKKQEELLFLTTNQNSLMRMIPITVQEEAHTDTPCLLAADGPSSLEVFLWRFSSGAGFGLHCICMLTISLGSWEGGENVSFDRSLNVV
jgi:hypothetical protein